MQATQKTDMARTLSAETMIFYLFQSYSITLIVPYLQFC